MRFKYEVDAFRGSITTLLTKEQNRRRQAMMRRLHSSVAPLFVMMLVLPATADITLNQTTGQCNNPQVGIMAGWMWVDWSNPSYPSCPWHAQDNEDASYVCTVPGRSTTG